MALPVPERMGRDRFRNQAEYEVYETAVQQLSDDWFVIPSLEVRLKGDSSERELDLVFLHPTRGIVIVEVKSFAIEIRGGQFFYAEGGRLDKDPREQVRSQHQHLASMLEPILPHAFQRIHWAIATPLTISVEGILPSGLKREQLLDSQRLVEFQDAILDLCDSQPFGLPLGRDLCNQVLEALCPDVEIESSEMGLRLLARSRMADRLRSETRVLETLDVNQRVLVTGGPGSGKTRLAAAWVRRAWLRDERILLTCFNEPLAQVLASEFSEYDDVAVAPFFPLMAELTAWSQTDPEPVAGDDWDHVLIAAIDRLHDQHVRFDTIIVDEAQDFSPAWLVLLGQLLAADGPKRMLLLADPSQNLRHAAFEDLDLLGNWSRAELLSNNRSAPSIATLLRRRLNGPPAPNRDPFGDAVEWCEVRDADDAIEVVERLLAKPPVGISPETWVLTTTRPMRDRLRSDLCLVPWEDREEGIVCESVRRLKGLDVERVIFVVDQLTPEAELQELLLTGASRANECLIVVGSKEIGDLLGLTPDVE